jgi:hypothetical protein
MKFFKENKTLIFGIILAGLLVYVYFVFFRNDSASEELLTTSSNTSVISTNLLVTLSSLRVITLDNSLFSDPIFQSLSDAGVEIAPQNVGRRNPFAPIGSN